MSVNDVPHMSDASVRWYPVAEKEFPLFSLPKE